MYEVKKKLAFFFFKYNFQIYNKKKKNYKLTKILFLAFLPYLYFLLQIQQNVKL